MKILCDKTYSTQQLTKTHQLLDDSQMLPSKLNIKLKTHSLTCLDVPLETFSNFKRNPSSFRNDQQRTLAGSVDLISEIQQQQFQDENLSRYSSSKPLINIVSSDQPLSTSQQQWKQHLKQRFRLSNSFLTPSSVNDSIVRLRRSGHVQNLHQSSLQTVNKTTKQKRSLLLNDNGPIPKFSFRDLPSYSRKISSVNRLEQTSDFRISPYTSLPELQSYAKKNYSHSKTVINNKYKRLSLNTSSSSSSSWQKSRSWSWKSNDILTTHSNVVNKSTQYQLDDHYHQHYRDLPIIIESPIQQRSSSKTNDVKYHYSSTQLANIFRPNPSCSNENILHERQRLYQKKRNFPHSHSNYEVCQDQPPWQSVIRYPSTPLLAYSRQKKLLNKNFDYHLYDLDKSSISIYDEDEDTDTLSRHSSFRSCLNSIHDYSEHNLTDLSLSSTSSLSSSSLESCFDKLSSSYDLKTEIFNETMKNTRSSIRYLCIIQ